MSDRAPQVQSGSLSAKIIRACGVHQNTCDLECPERKTQDLGVIARFRPRLPSPSEGVKTGKSDVESIVDTIRRRFT